MSKKVYFCNNCRKKIEKVQQLLFVEESKRGFCSENCIVEFFSPYMEYFDHQELEYRHMFNLDSNEVPSDTFSRKDLFDQVLYAPTEVWLEKNEIQEEFYTHILQYGEHKDLFYIVICTYFEGEPSFVYFKTVTRSKDLLNLYRKIKRLDTSLAEGTSEKAQEESFAHEKEHDQGLEEINLPSEIVDELELKKSEYLATYLEKRKDSDFALEDFPNYDKYIGLTLDDADEEFAQVDAAGDDTMTFIKSFQVGSLSFFYVVCCLKMTVPNMNEKVMIPIISFPSTDKEIYRHYAVGEKKNSKLKS
jgi:hypothetical protein